MDFERNLSDEEVKNSPQGPQSKASIIENGKEVIKEAVVSRAKKK